MDPWTQPRSIFVERDTRQSLQPWGALFTERGKDRGQTGRSPFFAPEWGMSRLSPNGMNNSRMNNSREVGVKERLLTPRRIGTDVGEVKGADLEVFGELVVHNQRGSQRLTGRSDHGR